MLTPYIAEQLKHYVYAYVDPANDEIFYVGKGVGDRALAHLDDRSEAPKTERIKKIRAAGAEPRIEFIAHGLRDDDEACRIEAALIDVLPNLTNKVRGLDAATQGRFTLDEARARFTVDDAEIEEPALLIRINRLYQSKMSAQELYEATRSSWVIGAERRRRAMLAMPVFNGVIREVYEILEWRPVPNSNRWEFEGRLAPDEVRSKYRYKRYEFPQGLQSPIVGVKL